MNLRKIDLNLLTVFDAIISEGQITRAAERLGMSQPAMSNALQRLRYVVGDDLFVKSGRGIRPTVYAKQLGVEVHEALERIEHALNRFEPFDANITYTFNISGFDYAEIVILPKLIELISKDAPNINLKVEYGIAEKARDSLRYGDIDLIFDYVPITHNDFCSEILLEEILVAIVNTDHPIRTNRMSLNQFLSFKHVIIEKREGEESQINNYLFPRGKARKIAVEMENISSMVMTVATSDMIAAVHQRAARILSKIYNTRTVSIPIPQKPAPIYMIWHKSKSNIPAHKWLRESIFRICHEL